MHADQWQGPFYKKIFSNKERHTMLLSSQQNRAQPDWRAFHKIQRTQNFVFYATQSFTAKPCRETLRNKKKKCPLNLV